MERGAGALVASRAGAREPLLHVANRGVGPKRVLGEQLGTVYSLSRLRESKGLQMCMKKYLQFLLRMRL